MNADLNRGLYLILFGVMPILVARGKIPPIAKPEWAEKSGVGFMVCGALSLAIGTAWAALALA
jgi:hypothetical protein